MAVNINDVIRVTANMNFQSLSLIQNVFHMKVTDDSIPDEEDFRDAVALMLDTAYAYLVPHQHTTFSYTDIDFYNITQDVPMVTEPWPVISAGTAASGCLPLQAAALVTFNTAGKKSVGRKYLSGFDEGASDNGGALTAGALTGLGNYAGELLAGTFVASAIISCGNYRPLTSTFYPWVGNKVKSYYRTQRRRVVGVGI